MSIPPLSIAPMMDRTDRHYRYFMRLISKHTLLYTEMVTVQSIIHGNRDRLLGYNDIEHPVALQLGGDDPQLLAQCAQLAQDMGYDEVNLNVGCPSSRVKSGNFGACLMGQPEVVARAVESMMNVVDIPVTVKHRIGIDDLDKYEDMANFVSIVSQTGVQRFTVHARKAWLQGLSPKQNRTVPPLRYADVYQLKIDFPHLDIEINGGIKTMNEVEDHLKSVDAVMIGRAAYDNPWQFNDAHEKPSRLEVAEKMLIYIEEQIAKDVRMMSITRHILNLFAGQPGARKWRRALGEASSRKNANPQKVRELLLTPQLVR